MNYTTKVTKRTKKSRAPLVTALLITSGIAAIIAVIAISNATERDSAAQTAQVVRDNSHRLDTGSEDGPVLVEFLDFECEACGAAYPAVERLREEYAGELTYVIRYFPIPSHRNSTTAAIAVEAAAQQGRLDDMYRMMYETQLQWGEAQESKASLFREYAVALELDMDAFDEAVADPATAARVRFDFDEGNALGVQSTPTFFLDGKLLNLTTFEDLNTAVAAAVEK